MSMSKISSLITQNRLLSQARSRARAQSVATGSALLNGSHNKDSVINSVNNKAGAQNAKVSEADRKSKENYTAMKNAAESVKKHAKNLLLWPEKKWDEMTEDEIAEYKVDARKEITSLIENYNTMIKSMNEEQGKVNEIYLKQMKGYFQNAKKDLESLGIIQKEDGTLSLDQELLKAADAETLKKVLGSEGTFVDDIGKRAENVISNAETNLAVINKSIYAGNYTYNQYGSDIFDALLGGKYNSKG